MNAKWWELVSTWFDTFVRVWFQLSKYNGEIAQWSFESRVEKVPCQMLCGRGKIIVLTLTFALKMAYKCQLLWNLWFKLQATILFFLLHITYFSSLLEIKSFRSSEASGASKELVWSTWISCAKPLNLFVQLELYSTPHRAWLCFYWQLSLLAVTFPHI